MRAKSPALICALTASTFSFVSTALTIAYRSTQYQLSNWIGVRTRQNPVNYTNRILGILPRRPPYSEQQKEDQSNRSWEAPGAILNRARLPQKHAIWRHKPPYG